MQLRRLVHAGIAAAVLSACAASEDLDDELVDDETPATAADAITAQRELKIDEDIRLLVEHPDTLSALEARGFDLGSRLTGAPIADNRGFAASPEGRSIIAAVEADVAEVEAGDREIGVGMAFSHRAFDKAWLASKATRFELVAVANRIDRRHATLDGCGELHLVYRLAYANAQTSSRLPMTLMLVYPQAKTGGTCAAAAGKWATLTSNGQAAAKADALVAGPLANLAPARKVETNFQLVRWPSTTRTDMGGYAEYSLRVFERGTSGLVPRKVENTPRENLSASDKTALAAWVRANLAGIDRGTAKLPAALLADKAISVSPKGLARGQNRPFALALGKDGAGLGNVSLANLTLATSKTALVRRLDTLSCNGCHQSQGLAGFQILGHDRKETPDVNALVEGVSPHVREQLTYRLKDLAEVARGKMDQAPIPFAERAIASGAFAVEGGYGATCGLGDPGFARWTCATGFQCSDINGDDVGICVSAGRKRTAGEACEEATVTFDADSRNDSVKMNKVFECVTPTGNASRCVRSGGDPGGFPTGMCGGGCTTMGKVEKTGICGVAVPSGFNACIGAGRPFETCTAGGPKAYRKACSTNDPCGPDYVCSAVPNAPAGIGACLPPYFIFQARVDGHIVK